MNSQENNQKLGIEYYPASTKKKLLAFLIDFIIVASVSGLFWFLSSLAFNSLSYIKEQQDYRTSYQIDSGFYNSDLKIITAELESSDLNIKERCETLDKKINNYYFEILKNENVSKEYQKRQNESGYYKLDEETNKYVINTSDYSNLYNFQKNELYSYTLGYFFLDAGFYHATQTIFLSIVIEIIIALFLSCLIFMLILPLFVFKRGRCTLGNKIMKIGLVSSDALNVRAGKFIGRFFFIFIVEIVFSMFSFFLPLLVSLAFSTFSKTRNNLHNYIFGTYLVDSSQKMIYLNREDFFDNQRISSQASIENKDFRIE